MTSPIREPGPTTPRGVRAAAAALVVFAGILAAPAVIQAALEIVRGERVQALDLFRFAPTEANLRRFEDELAEGSWLTALARRSWAPAVDATLWRGSSQVVFGRTGWLFYRRGVEFVAAPAFDGARARRLLGSAEPGDGAAADPDAAFEAVVDYRDRLAERGIELIFLPVPVKPTIYPERLAGGADPTSLPDNPGVERLLRRLREAGVEVVDPAPALLAAKLRGEKVFLPLDTHWTPVGARLVAELVAERVRSLARPALPPPTPFDTRRVRIECRGDVYDMLPYAEAGRLFEAREVEIRQIAETPAGAGPRDVASPVLVLGDSLSGVFSDPALGLGRRAGFPELVAAELGMSVDWIASPGGGAAQARRALALRSGGLAGKRVVVWQVTRRDLLFSADGWPRVDLPAPTAQADAHEDETYRVLAWVVEASRWSGPLDYRDCLSIVHYRLIEGTVPGAEDGELFVAHWGWRRFRRTAVGSVKPRTVHELVLRRLPREHSLESTCWIDTVGMDRVPWWPESYVER